MKKSEIHLNINKEDFNTNDYLYCWDYFKERPSKIVIYDNFEFDKFEELLNDYQSSEECSLLEVIPFDKNNLLNKKNFTKLSEDVFLTYTSFDSDLDDSFVNDIFLYFNKKGSDLVSEFVDKLNDLNVEVDTDDTKEGNLYSLSFEGTGFETKSLNLRNVDLDNIDLYYNDHTIKSVNKLIKTVNKNKKGLTIIHGERGVGKTSLLKYLSQKISKKFIFIPCSCFETTIINPDFRNFLSKNTDSVIILDDVDIYFSEIYSKSNIFTNNVLQLVDGLDSDEFNLNIISVLNVSNVDEIDHTLLDCNNLIEIIEINELDIDKAKKLSKHLGKKLKSKESCKLSTFFRKNEVSKGSQELGF
jgi:hypothetical protein